MGRRSAYHPPPDSDILLLEDMAAYKVHGIYPYDNEQGRKIQQIGNKLLGKRNTTHVEQFIQGHANSGRGCKSGDGKHSCFFRTELKEQRNYQASEENTDDHAYTGHCQECNPFFRGIDMETLEHNSSCNTQYKTGYRTKDRKYN